MIGFAYDLVVEHIVAPQDQPDRGELRVFLDPSERPLDVAAQEIAVVARTTIPSGVVEIGGTIGFRHSIACVLDVQHGDPAEARRLRDAILLELVLRWRDTRDVILSARDDATGEEIVDSRIQIDYRPVLGASDTNESATLTVTIETLLDS